MTASMTAMTIQRKQMICTYEVFSEDSEMNRILKSTLILLLHAQIAKERKKRIRSMLAYFSGIQEVDLREVDWHMQFDRNNQNYRMMMGICNLVVKGLLQQQKDGSVKLMGFSG